MLSRESQISDFTSMSSMNERNLFCLVDLLLLTLCHLSSNLTNVPHHDSSVSWSWNELSLFVVWPLQGCDIIIVADEAVELFGHVTNVPQENVVVFIAWKKKILCESVEVKSVNLTIVSSFSQRWFKGAFSDVIKWDLFVLGSNCKDVGVSVHPLDFFANLCGFDFFEWQ